MDENIVKESVESSDRHYCDLHIAKQDTNIEIEKTMVDMKYLRGKISMLA